MGKHAAVHSYTSLSGILFTYFIGIKVITNLNKQKIHLKIEVAKKR